MGQMTAGASQAAGNNMFWNAGFEEGTLEPWASTVSSPAKGSVAVVNQEACFNLEGGGANAYDVLIRQRQIGILLGHKYQVRFKAHSTAPTKLRPKMSKAGPPYTEYWSALVETSSTPQTFAGSFDASVSDEAAEFVIHLGGDLTGQTPLTVCLDDIELNDPQYKIPEERSAKPLTSVRVNQLGYLPAWPKIATIKSTSAEPLEWQLVDAGGKVVASGKTKPFGEDKAAGELVHNADFSSFTQPGKGYKLKVGAEESYPFDIAPDLYQKLKYDSLAFFYYQRSGIDIKQPYAAAEKWARPAGHLGDKSVPCAPEAKCKYSLDVTGGWYDAGDHGKYVVNAGISIWTLQNEYETLKYLGRTADDFGDGKMSVPENKNGKPDLLDETRFEMEWMLKMQVPAGQPMAGMAHHSVHSEKWSPIPTMPHEDNIKRFLRPVTTTATLNLAGAAAQAARLWKTLDPAFSKKCLEAAETAYQAAKKNPNVIAEPMLEGGGPYGDSLFEDEFYWAAAELFITTGKPEYKAAFVKSPFHKTIPTAAGGGTACMSWDHLAALGKISLAVVPNSLSKAEVQEQRKQIIGAADKFLANIQKRGYRMPLESEAKYPWGSNVFVVNDMVIFGLAYDFTKDKKYANGVVDSMDYLLGRNPKVQSYITGYGSRPLTNPHHRVWAHQKNPKYAGPPPGIVSGGPNSGLEDPYAKQVGLPGCSPQKCFVDHIESWSTNEIAINWNAPLAWAAAFLDEVGKGK
jgi:endoglucanase